MEFTLTNIKQWDKYVFTVERSGSDHWTKWSSLALQEWAGLVFGGAFWCDVARSTQHHPGGVLARNVLSKCPPEERSNKFRREHFREQVAWIPQRIQCHEDQRKMRGDSRGVTSSIMGVWLEAELKIKKAIEDVLWTGVAT